MEPDKIRHTARYKKLRKRIVRERKYCRNCKATKDLQIHHVIKISQEPAKAFDADNIILLCKRCHQLTHKKEYV